MGAASWATRVGTTPVYVITTTGAKAAGNIDFDSGRRWYPQESAAPGYGAGAHFRVSGYPAGRLADLCFRATVVGGSARPGSNIALFGEDADGVLQRLVKTGDSAPGFASGVKFSGLRDPVMTSVKSVGFGAIVSGAGVTAGSNDTLWLRSQSGVLSLIAREAFTLPGAPEGAQLRSVTSMALPESPLDQMFFTASLRSGPGGITKDNDTGLWGMDSAGELRVLFLRGRRHHLRQSAERVRGPHRRSAQRRAGTQRQRKRRGPMARHIFRRHQGADHHTRPVELKDWHLWFQFWWLKQLRDMRRSGLFVRASDSRDRSGDRGRR